MSKRSASSAGDFYMVEASPETATVRLRGRWTFERAARLEAALEKLDIPGRAEPVFECGELEAIDLSGAWLLFRKTRELEQTGRRSHFEGFRDTHLKFLREVADRAERAAEAEAEAMAPPPGLRQRAVGSVESVGRATVTALSDTGYVAQTLVEGLAKPSRLAVRETLRQIDQTGFRAIPIVALIAFMTGVVLAYQGAVELAQFGADVFTVDLAAISILREMGVLLTAIMVAGRSGSAFAATLGVMKLNEEMDAMRVMGLDPNRLLVAPRVIALIVTVPLLTAIANAAGLFGTWVLVSTVLDLPTAQFMERLNTTVEPWTFLTGMVKAPVLAVAIAGVSTLRGMQVRNSADDLGRKTTRAVVESIFLVIVLDAGFSIIFSRLGI